MKIPFFLLFILLTFISGYTAETEEKNYMFSEGYLGLEGGDAYPWGTTEDAIQPALFGQGNFTYRYWKNTYGIVQFGYAYFKTYTEFKRFPGVHQFHGRVGLEHQFSWLRPLFLGAGFSCIWARSDGGDQEDKGPGVMLTDNESEFGTFLKVRLPIWKNEKYAIGANIYWEQLWTLPEKSNMLWIGVFVQRRMW